MGFRISGKVLPTGSFNLRSVATTSYSLSSTALTVNEGQQFTITLTTSGLADGSVVPYTITGVTSSDINDTGLTGNFTITGNTASRVFTVTADQTTEGNEVFLLTLDGGLGSISVTFNDTSLTPTYFLSSSVASINEGSSATITLTTTNLANGTLVPYTITGISLADLLSGSLTGNFTIVDGSATRVIEISSDYIAEGPETLVLTLDNSLATVSVTINDTSNGPTYSLSRSASTVDEGATVTITLTTGGVSNGTLVPYTITGVSSADLNGASLTGNFTVNSNTASQVFTITNDLVLEGVEVATLTLDAGGTNISVTINDTSVPATGVNWWNWGNTTLNNTAVVAPTSAQQIVSEPLPAATTWSNWDNTLESRFQVSTNSSAILITSEPLPAATTWSNWDNTLESRFQVSTDSSAQQIV